MCAGSVIFRATFDESFHNQSAPLVGCIVFGGIEIVFGLYTMTTKNAFTHESNFLPGLLYVFVGLMTMVIGPWHFGQTSGSVS